MSEVRSGTVVSLAVEFYDAQGEPLEASGPPVVYLHGGYGELLVALERALEGRRVGETVRVQLEPEDAFGDYDPALLRVEPCGRYGDGLQVGMEVEDAFEGGETRRYTVTEIAEDKAVLDANHPLAGMALRVQCRVLEVRAASAEELRAGAARDDA